MGEVGEGGPAVGGSGVRRWRGSRKDGGKTGEAEKERCFQNINNLIFTKKVLT